MDNLWQYPETYGVEIYDIDLHHLPGIGWGSVEHQFYVEISIDDYAKTRQVTSKEKPSSMPWTDRRRFSEVHDSTILTLEVYVHRNLHHNQYIGMVRGSIEQFLRYPGAVVQKLMYKDEPLHTGLQFKIEVIGRPAQAALSHDVVKLPPAVRIIDIDLHHLPRIGLISADDRKFYVRAFVDMTYDHKSTTAEELQSLPWETPLNLNVQSSSTICFQVFAKRRFHEDELVGMVNEPVGALLARPGTNIHYLMSPDGNDRKRASMEFKIIPLNSKVPREEQSTNGSYEHGIGEHGLDDPSLRSAGVVTAGAAVIAIFLFYLVSEFIVPSINSHFT